MSRSACPDRVWVGGIHTVRSLLKSDPQGISELLHDEARRDRRVREVLDLAAAAGVPIRHRARREISQLAGADNHQGVLVRYTNRAPDDESGLLARLDARGDHGLILALDGVQDPHNLGACLRVAEGAGVDAVVLSRHASTGLTPVVRKVASGAVESLAICQVVNLPRTLQRLQRRGYWVYGAAGESSSDLYSLQFAMPSVIVLGGEGRGLGRLTRKRCDSLFSIPMQGQVESLNVSVATGIALFECVRQRRQTRNAGYSVRPV